MIETAFFFLLFAKSHVNYGNVGFHHVFRGYKEERADAGRKLNTSMYAKSWFVAAVACGLTGADAFMVAPALTRANVRVTSASARAGVAPLRNPLAARKSKTARGAASGLSKMQMAKVKAEYIWVGGRGGGGDDYRSKTRVLDSMPTSVSELPLWNYDGSSTGQVTATSSEFSLH